MENFIGEGVVLLQNGKYLQYGDPIPKELPKETIANMKKKGQIGKVPTLESTKVGTENESLKKKLAEKIEEMKKVSAEKDKMEAKLSGNESEKIIKDLEKENEVLTARVEELEKLIDDTAVDSEEGVKTKESGEGQKKTGLFGGLRK